MKVGRVAGRDTRAKTRDLFLGRVDWRRDESFLRSLAQIRRRRRSLSSSILSVLQNGRQGLKYLTSRRGVMRWKRLPFVAAFAFEATLGTARPQTFARRDYPLRHAPKRELGGLLGGLDATTAEVVHQVHTEPASTIAHIEHTAASAQTTPIPNETASPHAGDKTTSSHSNTGTPPPTLAPPTPGTWTPGPSPTQTQYAPIATLRPGPEEPPPPPVPAGPGPDWRVIGVAVIAVSVIGSAILAVVFFDQWWRFVHDVCGGRRRKRKEGVEELVPDWEKGSWEYRPEKEDGENPFDERAQQRGSREGIVGEEQGRGREARNSVVMAASQHLEVPPRPLLRAPSNAKQYDPHGGGYLPRDANYLSPANPAHDPGSPAYTYHSPVPSAARVHRSNTTRSTTQDDVPAHEHYESPVSGGRRVHRSNTARSTNLSP